MEVCKNFFDMTPQENTSHTFKEKFYVKVYKTSFLQSLIMGQIQHLFKIQVKRSL